MAGFVVGSLRTLAIVASFVVSGVGVGSMVAPHVLPRGANAVPYTPERMDDEREEEPRVWLVDGFNALHVALLRGSQRESFWTRAARERLLALVRGFEDRSAEIWVVFDGPHPLPEPVSAEEGPRVAFAASADEWLVRKAAGLESGSVAIVTADRRLAARARARGARVVSPHAFLARCAAPGS